MISKRRLVVVKREVEEERRSELGRRFRNVLLPLLLLVLPQWWFGFKSQSANSMNFGAITQYLPYVSGEEEGARLTSPVEAIVDKVIDFTMETKDNQFSAMNPLALPSNQTQLFIHVGPVKTGSSSIQCNLQVNPFLKNSSYDFFGRSERRDKICPPTKWPNTKKKFFNAWAFVFQYILRGWLKQDQHQGYRNNFIAGMTEKDAQNIDTILSAEEFCGLLSLAPNFTEIFRKEGIASFNGKNMASILDEKDAYLIPNPKGLCSPYNMYVFLTEKLLPLLDRGRIDVLSMYGDGDLATRYICRLPHAQNVCQLSRKRHNLARARQTDLTALHADLIATAAWEAKLLPPSLQNQRIQARSHIKDFVQQQSGLNTTFQHLPMECIPDDEVSKLYNMTLDYGEAMHMLDTKLLDCEKAERLLEAHITKKKFCSVNTSAILADEQWLKFFARM